MSHQTLCGYVSEWASRSSFSRTKKSALTVHPTQRRYVRNAAKCKKVQTLTVRTIGLDSWTISFPVLFLGFFLCFFFLFTSSSLASSSCSSNLPTSGSYPASMHETRAGRPGPARKARISAGRAQPGPQFWQLLRGNLKNVFHSSSESRNHSCKEFHALSAPFHHCRFNLLFTRFWLITAVNRAGSNNRC